MDRPSHLRFGKFVIWLVVAACAASVSAQTLAAGGADTSPAEGAPAVTVATEAGWERLGEDAYVASALKVGIDLPVPELLCDATEDECGTQFRAGLQAPLRLRVVDRSPFDAGTVRRADWDSPSDYLRVLRYLEYGGPGSAVRVRAGELGALTLGHGTIVDDYFNVVSPDDYRAGARMRVDVDAGGGQVFVNDVVAPQVIGGRVHLRPAQLGSPTSWWSRVSVGASVVGDVSAPTELSRDIRGRPEIGPERKPAVEARRGTAIGGLDVSVRLLDTPLVEVEPYTDLNVHFGLGEGLHSGFRTEFAVSDAVQLSGRFEFRALSGRYLPGYFGPLYQIDRYQFSGWGVLLPTPKLRVAAAPRSGTVLGGYGEITGRVSRILTASVAYGDHAGPDNATAKLAVRTQPIDRIRFGAYFYKHGFDSIGRLLSRDGSLFVAESRVRAFGPLYAKAAYGLLWSLQNSGTYRPVHRWNVGVGASFGF